METGTLKPLLQPRRVFIMYTYKRERERRPECICRCTSFYLCDAQDEEKGGEDEEGVFRLLRLPPSHFGGAFVIASSSFPLLPPPPLLPFATGEEAKGPVGARLKPKKSLTGTLT